MADGLPDTRYTRVPNNLLDRMGELSPAEFKVLSAICRLTFGWQKAKDVISLTQLEELTNLSRTAVQAGIMAGIRLNLLERAKVGKQYYSYQLVVSDYQLAETTGSLRLPELVVSDYQLEPKLVVSDYIPKKDLKKGKKQQQQPIAEGIKGRLERMGLWPNQIETVLKAREWTDADLDLCALWVKHSQLDSPVGTLYNQFLRRGLLPDAPAPVSRANGKYQKQLAKGDYRMVPLSEIPALPEDTVWIAEDPELREQLRKFGGK